MAHRETPPEIAGRLSELMKNATDARLLATLHRLITVARTRLGVERISLVDSDGKPDIEIVSSHELTKDQDAVVRLLDKRRECARASGMSGSEFLQKLSSSSDL